MSNRSPAGRKSSLRGILSAPAWSPTAPTSASNVTRFGPFNAAFIFYFLFVIESDLKRNVMDLNFTSGVLHSARPGGSRAPVAQRDAAVRVRDLRENLRPRSEPGSAQSSSLPGTRSTLELLHTEVNVEEHNKII